ncbi:MAG: hypothetical protein J1F28_06950 [Oscillospiraceae bacterium]|nr:hypothetical protein [Oscillospiraceae bacterium]
MTADKIKSRIEELCTNVSFILDGKNCGIDPISRFHYDMWYGENAYVASSIDDVMNVKMFNGKSLTEVADKIEITEW